MRKDARRSFLVVMVALCWLSVIPGRSGAT